MRRKLASVRQINKREPFPNAGPYKFSAVMLARADGLTTHNQKQLREGIVCATSDEQHLFKAISNKFLLKGKE